MAIPEEITRRHILQALRDINRRGVPPTRQSTRYCLLHQHRRYPPKYVLTRASFYATGKEWPASSFSGGSQTNRFLQRLGFRIVGPEPHSYRRPVAKPRHPATRQPPNAPHSERCAACKANLYRMLRRMYGTVKTQARLDIPVRPSNLRRAACYSGLRAIHRTLSSYRGHTGFIRSDALPPVDFLIHDPRFVLEFDERQHFTEARRRSLEAYPANVVLGFDCRRWIQLCKAIGAHDNDPPDRDEQRAWYDTIRDHLHIIENRFEPTVRCRASDLRWCTLDPTNDLDRAIIRDWLPLPVDIDVSPVVPVPTDPFFARVIIQGPWHGGQVQAHRLLEALCQAWPTGIRSRALVTCGGFLNFPWPTEIGPKQIGDVRYPDPDALDAVLKASDEAVSTLLDSTLRQQLLARTDAVTFGVDSFKPRVSIAGERLRDLHVELVYLVNLETGHWSRTGKSYPTTAQQRGLVRIADLESHFCSFGSQRVLLLGCHDLKAFSPRGNAVAKGWRREVIREWHRLTAQRSPRIVLHHPHTTDTPAIWQAEINRLRALSPRMKLFASAGRYYSHQRSPRASLAKVLRSTVFGSCLDLGVTITLKKHAP